MIEIPREEFLKDPTLKHLHDAIKRGHKVPKHTQDNLMMYEMPDMCEDTRHFATLDNDLFIHYDTQTWMIDKESFGVKIVSIGWYDNFIEYEAARVGQIQAGDGGKDLPNQN